MKTIAAVLLIAVLLAVPARAQKVGGWDVVFIPLRAWTALGYSPEWNVFWMCNIRLIHARDGLQGRKEEVLADVKKRCATRKPGAKPARQKVTA